MLKLKFTDNRQDPFWVMEKNFNIGKLDSNHLVVSDTSIADQHAKIMNQGEKFLLKDLGSLSGTFVNEQRVTQKLIACGDRIKLGDVELEVIDPLHEDGERKSTYWSLIADSSWLSGQEFPLKASIGGKLSIGRGANCDIILAGTHLSRHHAEIIVNGHSLTLKDMGSANGTFVNDEQITEVEIKAGDRVRFDVYSFRVFGPGIELSKSATSKMRAISAPEPPTKAAQTTKQWKAKSTSPGNREQIDLYKKNWRPLAWAILVILASALIIGYAIAGF